VFLKSHYKNIFGHILFYNIFTIWTNNKNKVKVRDKFCPRTGHEDPEME